MSRPAAVTRQGAAEIHPIDVLLDTDRPRRRPGALTASAIFGRRAVLKIKHDPKQLVESVAVPIVITVLFTYIFGGAISGSPGTYLKTLLPGTLSMSIAIVTMYGGARLAQDVTTGAFDRFRSLPVWRGAFVLGGLLSDAGRYLFASTIVVGLGLVMGYRPAGGAPGVLAAVVSALEPYFEGSVERRTYEYLAEECLLTALVPANQQEYFAEIPDRRLREKVIRHLLLDRVLPELMSGPAGTAHGVNVEWKLGRYTCRPA
jgi:hypothetical protein